MEKQPKRYEHIEIKHHSNQFDKKGWIKTGLSWGAFMFVIMSIGFPFIDGQEITWKSLILGLVMWTIGGLAFGYIMKLFINKGTNNNDNTYADRI